MMPLGIAVMLLLTSVSIFCHYFNEEDPSTELKSVWGASTLISFLFVLKVCYEIFIVQ